MKPRYQKLFTVVLTAALVIILAYQTCSIGYDLYLELTFDSESRSDAENTIMAFAKKNHLSYSDYPESIIELLKRNPETEKFVLEYPLECNKAHTVDLSEYKGIKTVPLFMQWDQRWGYMTYGDDVAGLTACGPVCLSMAAFYLTGSDAYTPDKLITFAANNGYYAKGIGSSWTLISEGGKKLGLEATELPLVKGKIIQHLEAGDPVICVMGPGDFTSTGHFIVLTGYENGMLRVNDPNSYKNSQKLWAYEDIEGQIRNLWAMEYPAK